MHANYFKDVWCTVVTITCLGVQEFVYSILALLVATTNLRVHGNWPISNDYRSLDICVSTSVDQFQMITGPLVSWYLLWLYARLTLIWEEYFHCSGFLNMFRVKDKSVQWSWQPVVLMALGNGHCVCFIFIYLFRQYFTLLFYLLTTNSSDWFRSSFFSNMFFYLNFYEVPILNLNVFY